MSGRRAPAKAKSQRGGGRRVSRAQVVTEIQRRAGRRRSLAVVALLPAHHRLVADAIRVFGSFGAARRAAGLVVAAPPTTAAAIRAALIALHDGWGTRLSARTLRQLGEDELLAACEARFGSLIRARADAGLTVGRPRPTPPPKAVRRQVAGDAAVEELRAIAARVGRTPRMIDLPRPVGQALLQRFGWYSVACEVAGLTLRTRRRPFPVRRAGPG